MPTDRSPDVQTIIDDVADEVKDSDPVVVGDITDALGHRGIGPFLMFPALLGITPLAAVPGVPTVLAVIIGIFAAQIAFGRSDMWLPDVLRRRKVPGDKLDKSLEKLRPIADWLDRWFYGRWHLLTRSPARRAAAMVSLALCFAVPPLELVPLAVMGPMLAIAMFGLALTVRDGVLMAAGFAIAAVATPVALSYLI